MRKVHYPGPLDSGKYLLCGNYPGDHVHRSHDRGFVTCKSCLSILSRIDSATEKIVEEPACQTDPDSVKAPPMVGELIIRTKSAHSCPKPTLEQLNEAGVGDGGILECPTCHKMWRARRTEMGNVLFTRMTMTDVLGATISGEIQR